jgi:hypothetical protein
MASGANMIFDSSFEAGNGTWFIESPAGTANVTTEADPFPANATYGDYFYFSLANILQNKLSIRVDFKNDRNEGPYEGHLIQYIKPFYSYDQINWSRVSNTVYENETMFFNVPNIGTALSNKVYITLSVPYTYNQLQKDIYRWVATRNMTSTALGYSSGGREIYYLTVGSGLCEISITARTHPKEHESNWVLKGMLDFLTSNDQHAIYLRNLCQIHVFPMVNPDGVYEGRFLSFQNGENANRDFDIAGPDSIDEEIETYLIHRQIHALRSKLLLHIDMHSAQEALIMIRDSTYFSKTLESAIEDKLASYDTSGYWPSDFQQWDNKTGSKNVTYRYGLAEQYGLDVILLEGGVFKTGTTGYLSTEQLENAGKVAIESILEGVVDQNLELGGGGSGLPDPDMDLDGTPDYIDGCPNDSGKIQPGACGCGVSESDVDGDGILDCIDMDNDNDGLPDASEQEPDVVDPNYDGNDDGTADRLQDNVSSIYNYEDQYYVTLESPAGTSISNFKAATNPSPTNQPSIVDLSYGLYEFTLEGVSDGDSTVVNLYLPDGKFFDTYLKYGPTPNNPTNHWYEFLYDGQTGAIINGNIITLHLIDGIRGDDDLTANGTVIDIGGPGIFRQNTGSASQVGSSSGGGGGCFIYSLMAPKKV